MNPIIGMLVLVVLFLIGFPVPYAIAISGVVIMHLSTGIKWMSITSNMIGGVNSFTILCIPLFLFAGKLMNSCGITDRLFKAARAIVGGIPGGLGHVNILASFIFAGMSGTAIADAAGLGQIEIKAMDDAGYDRDFSCAITSTSSTLGPIVPPSMPLIVYGMVSGASVGALLVAGVIPGIVIALCMAALVSMYAVKRHYPRDKFISWKDTFTVLKDGILPCFTPVIIILGIYTGICTPTEAAAVCVTYAAFLGVVVYKAITWKSFWQVLRETVIDSGPICILLAVSTFFGSTLIRANIPQTMVGYLMGLIHSKWIFWILFNIAFLIIGMFMETVSAITILTPIVFPMAVAYGINPIHFGIVMVFNLMIGVISPPFGTCLFAVSKVGQISMTRLIKALGPWYILLVVTLAILVIFPQLSTLLPSMMSLGG
ncbi:TRAP transporter, DctM subunit [Clostridiales bacterium 1_7_47FAA]|nr:TRAP transporter large permease [Lachnoclostridium pacaense]EEQ58274.1 TRAP transporter, DctM subunit [Clostridiales bacterium 1_7_47FAA]MCC2817058.1 TRAP transporter large permease [Lachnoclostridium pacaense]